MAHLGSPDRVEPVTMPPKRLVALFGILLVVTLALSISNYGAFQLGAYIDDSSYVVLAQSIASSDDYGFAA